MNSEGLSLIVGLVLPVVIELAKKVFPNKRVINYAIALASSTAVGLGVTAFNGELMLGHVDSVLGSIGTALLASQTVYNTYWRGSSLEKRISKPK